MESPGDLKPKLSIIVPALGGYRATLAAIDSWEAQSCRDQLEILVLCPKTRDLGPIPDGQILVETDGMDLHEARSAGVRNARADYVVLAEDHCLPDRGWAQAVLNRLAEGWDVVGPALRSGNPVSSWTQASFLLGYSQWMAPIEAGPALVLPGNNAVLRKDLLLAMDSELERELLVAAFLLRRLRRQGHRFYLENQATMRHFDPAKRVRSLRIFVSVGLGFGALRTDSRGWIGRALYSLAAPAIAFRHWQRAAIHYRRAGAEGGLGPGCLLAAVPLALAWGLGESVGALMGVDRVTPLVSQAEIKPVSKSDACLK